jgi:hypothetical protein
MPFDREQVKSKMAKLAARGVSSARRLGSMRAGSVSFTLLLDIRRMVEVEKTIEFHRTLPGWAKVVGVQAGNADLG